MKDIIYPTIKKRFDELVSFETNYGPLYYYTKNDDIFRLIYSRSDVVQIDIYYFMLHYFGFTEGSPTGVFDSVFRKVLNERLGDKFPNLITDKTRFIYQKKVMPF